MSSLLARLAKRVVCATSAGRRHLDYIVSLERQRDALVDERSALMQERDALTHERDGEQHWRKAVVAELKVSHDRLARFHDRLTRFGDEIPYVPNGHYYSPVPSRKEAAAEEDRLFRRSLEPPRDVDLRPQIQLALLREISELCVNQPFTESAEAGRRYGFENPSYSYTDALCLHGLLRLLRPRRLIEVGSGHSSCMTLDTRELFLDGQLDCTFIDPHPELILSLIKDEDRAKTRILSSRVQDVDLSVFRALQDGDVLFIDSTHISKVGSDVNYLYFEVLPILADGVYVHIHDVFYPFEYPKAWVLEEGRAWNELYLLRALLQSSNAYEIQLMTSYLTTCHRAEVDRALPLAKKNYGGSIWLRKKTSGTR